MFPPVLIYSIIILFVLILFAVAFYAERSERLSKSVVNNPYVYSLSLAVYCTSWTFYGSVGRAANLGLSFLPIYLGATIMIILWPVFLKKIIKISKSRNLTTIPDFLAARYGNSKTLSIVATIVAVIGLIPYIGLQLTAISNTLMTVAGKIEWIGIAGFIIACLMGVFTIVFGARRADSSEKHVGLVFAVAFGSIIKLFAFLVVGIFTTYYLFDGFDDLMNTLKNSEFSEHLMLGEGTSTNYVEWLALTVMSMTSIIFLPRQFQMAVVENHDESHINDATWLLPLFLFLINIFVIPIAMGGLLVGNSVSKADYFVLTLPFDHGSKYLVLLAFIGGFSAATGMVIVEVLALSNMVMNSIVSPMLARFSDLSWFRAAILNSKRIAIMVIMMLAYLFTVFLGKMESLVELGLKSFEAVTLYAPAILIGIYWKKANKRGAIAGLIAGFVVWFYTTIFPVILKAELFDPEGFVEKFAQMTFFNPKALFGITIFGKWSHTLFWTLSINLLIFIGWSLIARQSKEDKDHAAIFVDNFEEAKPTVKLNFDPIGIEDILTEYLDREIAHVTVQGFLSSINKKENELTNQDLLALRDYAEKIVAGFIGVTMAAATFDKRLGH